MKIELDVFSGQANPTWELSASEVTELTARLANLPRQTQPVPEAGLGYRGFTLSNPQQLPGLPATMRVYEGTITMQEAPGLSQYQDVNGVESWLLELSRRAGYADILKEAGK